MNLYTIINKGETIGYIRTEKAENVSTMAQEKYGEGIYTIVKVSNTITKWVSVMDFSSERIEVYPVEIEDDKDDVQEQIEDFLVEKYNLDEIHFMITYDKPEIDIAE